MQYCVATEKWKPLCTPRARNKRRTIVQVAYRLPGIEITGTDGRSRHFGVVKYVTKASVLSTTSMAIALKCHLPVVSIADCNYVSEATDSLWPLTKTMMAIKEHRGFVTDTTKCELQLYPAPAGRTSYDDKYDYLIVISSFTTISLRIVRIIFPKCNAATF